MADNAYQLVGGFNLALWKMMEWKSVGVMTFPTEWKVIKAMFQSTNQSSIFFEVVMCLNPFSLSLNGESALIQNGTQVKTGK